VRALLFAIPLAAFVALAGCTDSPEPSRSAVPTLAPVPLPSGATGWPRATLTQVVVPRVGPDPTGPGLSFDTTGDAQRIDAGRSITVLSEPVADADAVRWVRGWLDEDANGNWPYGFVAWYPVDDLDVEPPTTCPTTATLATLAALHPFDRARCAGPAEITVDARTGRLPAAPMYDTRPVWYGRNDDPGVALYDPGEVKIGPGAILSASEARAWLEARVPPTVPSLPLGFFVRVHGHYGDASAATCTRTLSAGQPVPGAPVEPPADSASWCRSQLVVTAWAPLLGPEGRPVDPAAPQLHRREFIPPPGAVTACGGVGMSTLTVRIDPRAVDPVWIESGPQRRRSVAVFGNSFGVAFDPLRVVAANGVTLVDGEQLDPDRSKPGLELCPGGDTIWFDVGR
jgi:hypothetical protein